MPLLILGVACGAPSIEVLFDSPRAKSEGHIVNQVAELFEAILLVFGRVGVLVLIVLPRPRI